MRRAQSCARARPRRKALSRWERRFGSLRPNNKLRHTGESRIQSRLLGACCSWIPASAGMTRVSASCLSNELHPPLRGGWLSAFRGKPGRVCFSPHLPRHPISRAAKIGAHLPSPRGGMPDLSPPRELRVSCAHLVLLRGALARRCEGGTGCGARGPRRNEAPGRQWSSLRAHWESCQELADGSVGAMMRDGPDESRARCRKRRDWRAARRPRAARHEP